MTRLDFPDAGDAAWHPDAATLERSRIARLLKSSGIGGIAELHRLAIADPEWFWRLVVDDLGIVFDRPFTDVLDESAGKPFPRWFANGTLNLGANCLDRWADGPTADKPAVIWKAESGESRSVTFGELHRDAVRFSQYLRSRGIGKGDRVGLFVPMIPETAAAFLACARIGAIVVPVFSGYGPEAIAARMQACDVRVLVTADGFRRKGRHVVMQPVVEQVVAEAPSVQTVVVVRHLGFEVPAVEPYVSWDEALSHGQASGADGSYEAMDANDPVMIMYTSGTTGRPKGVVHSHGGLLVKAGHDFGYSFDVQSDDVFWWITDIGWLMGPLLIVGTFMFGATALFFEGAPDHPGPGRLWEVVEEEGVTVLGIAPTTVRSLAAAGESWLEDKDLSSLRAFATTGEPWNEGPWQWLFDRVGAGRLPIINYSGGTEIGGGILTCYPVLPINPVSFSGPVIGMDVDVVDEQGCTVVGEVGELVVRNTWPGMTHSFWQDPERYLEAYWSTFPEVWVHGDLALRDGAGYWYVTGRSDDTLKLAGKRVGPAEIESVMVGHPSVEEAAAIGVPDEVKGQSLVCFAVLVPDASGGPELEQAVRQLVADRLGRALAPARVHVVQGLPKTRNGKILRRVVRARYLGAPLGDLSTIEDVGVLAHIPESDKN
jgi:acetyl-CoA synthetase